MDSDSDSGGGGNNGTGGRDQDKFLPIYSITKIMKKAVPENGRISKEAKEAVQQCLTEFISFITNEASDRCLKEERKTINGNDIINAMQELNLDDYAKPLRAYLQNFRDQGRGRGIGGAGGGVSASSQPTDVLGGGGTVNSIYGAGLYSGGIMGEHFYGGDSGYGFGGPSTSGPLYGGYLQQQAASDMFAGGNGTGTGGANQQHGVSWSGALDQNSLFPPSGQLYGGPSTSGALYGGYLQQQAASDMFAGGNGTGTGGANQQYGVSWSGALDQNSLFPPSGQLYGGPSTSGALYGGYPQQHAASDMFAGGNGTGTGGANQQYVVSWSGALDQNSFPPSGQLYGGPSTSGALYGGYPQQHAASDMFAGGNGTGTGGANQQYGVSWSGALDQNSFPPLGQLYGGPSTSGPLYGEFVQQQMASDMFAGGHGTGTGGANQQYGVSPAQNNFPGGSGGRSGGRSGGNSDT